MLLLEAEYLGIVESLLQFGKFEEAEEYCLKILHNDIDINIESIATGIDNMDNTS
jgi:hypothetical protein